MASGEGSRRPREVTRSHTVEGTTLILMLTASSHPRRPPLSSLRMAHGEAIALRTVSSSLCHSRQSLTLRKRERSLLLVSARA